MHRYALTCFPCRVFIAAIASCAWTNFTKPNPPASLDTRLRQTEQPRMCMCTCNPPVLFYFYQINLCQHKLWNTHILKISSEHVCWRSKTTELRGRLGFVLTAISSVIAHDAHACDGSERRKCAVKKEIIRIGRQLCARMYNREYQIFDHAFGALRMGYVNVLPRKWTHRVMYVSRGEDSTHVVMNVMNLGDQIGMH